MRPPPDVAVDPNSFRRYFSQQLQGLTFNSKPIITSLTLFAHEHLVRMSGVVAQCLEEHLRTVSRLFLVPLALTRWQRHLFADNDFKGAGARDAGGDETTDHGDSARLSVCARASRT